MKNVNSEINLKYSQISPFQNSLNCLSSIWFSCTELKKVICLELKTVLSDFDNKKLTNLLLEKNEFNVLSILERAKFQSDPIINMSISWFFNMEAEKK